jgi:predicted NUDIX family phosphoesterase
MTHVLAAPFRPWTMSMTTPEASSSNTVASEASLGGVKRSVAGRPGQEGAGMRDEMVLCFPRTLLDEIGAFQGIRTDVGAYIPRILEAENTQFVPRAAAEGDPARKQVIPYVIIRKGDTYLHYVRGKGSGEKRLVAMGSIGIGGHINHGDENLFLSGLEFYEEALQRELHEELRMDGRFRTRIVALINDDSTPVGQVHFGIVHLCDLGGENVSKGEACITDLRFLTLPDLLARRDQMETWSQLCLDVLPGSPAGRLPR